MRLGELKKLLAQYSDALPVCGTPNCDPFDPTNWFEVCLVEQHIIDHVHYKEPVLVLEFNVL